MVGNGDCPGALREQTHDPVAHRETPVWRGGFDDDAGAFHAHRRVRVGVETQRDHDVAEVCGHRRQGDPNVPRLQRGISIGNRFQAQVFERARGAHTQAPRAITRWHQQAGNRAAAVYPRGVHLAVAPQHLRLAGGQHRRYSMFVKLRIGVDQHDSTGVLRLCRAHQSPYRRACQIGDILVRQRHRAARGDDQLPCPITGQPGSQHLEHGGGGRIHTRHHLTGLRHGLEHHRGPGVVIAFGLHCAPDTYRHRLQFGRGLRRPIHPEQAIGSGP